MVVLDGLGQGEILIGTRINIDLTNPGDVSWLKRDSGLRDSVVKRFLEPQKAINVAGIPGAHGGSVGDPLSCVYQCSAKSEKILADRERYSLATEL